MQDILYAHRATIEDKEKEAQILKWYQDISRVLIVSSAMIKELDDEEAMFDAINRIDLRVALNVVEGKHIDCVNPNCNFKGHANFYRAKDSQIWLYRCPCCGGGREVITFADLVIAYFKYINPGYNHRTIVRFIRRAFDVDFSSPFYQEIKDRLDYNKKVLEEADKDSYLGTLIRKRKLREFYESYSEVANMYTSKDNEIECSFYASRSIILKYFSQVEEVSKSNSIMEKVNLMADLGFITKIDSNEAPTELRKKVFYRAVKEDEMFYKDVSVYQVNKITDEQLLQAEEYAKAIITNKIYRNKSSLDKSISEACSFTNEEIKFLDRANKAIKEELESKGYIALSSVVSKIDKKAKFYKKKEKEELFKLLEDRILLEANVKKIKATASNKKKYNMKRVIDKEVILIKDDKSSDISERILVEESVRVIKKNKSIKRKNNKKPVKEPVVVATWIDKEGCTWERYDDGTEDMIDIPF